MSLSQVVGAAAGLAVGFITENPQAGFATYAAVSGVGAYLSQPNQEGPRLDDLRMQMSSYGANIPVNWGVNRYAGTVIWPKILELKESSRSESAKGGPEATSFSYSCSIAVLLCEGPIAGVRRIWANKKLVYDASVDSAGPTKDPAINGLRFYLGTEDQEADPLIEATDGPSPAYLGCAYVVFEDYDLTDAGNRPPQFEFEVITEGAASNEPPVRLGNGTKTHLYTNPSTGEQTLWSVQETNVYVYSLPGGELLQTIALPQTGVSITSITGEVWIGFSNSGFGGAISAIAINPATYAFGASTNFGYTGVVSRLGTLVANGAVLYAFVDNGVGSGAQMYPTNTASGISVPGWVYSTLEMPDIFKAALAGYGNWLVIADFATDTTAATIINPDWGVVQEHRLAHDASRNCVYWASVGSSNVYKVDLAVYTLERLITVAGVQGLHYNSADDTIYVDVADGVLNAYSPESGALTGTIAGAGVMIGYIRGNSIDVGSAEHYFISENGGLWRINLKGALAPAKIPLSQIVGDICNRAGLGDADIDVSQLTDLVDGYIISRQMSGRAAIEPLQQAFYFDAVESDDKLKFVKRGVNAPVLIPMESRSAREFGADLPDSVSIVRAQDMELPVQVDVEYPDVDADHLIGNQYDRRITKDTKQRLNLQLPIVMNAEKGKQVAIVNLYALWLNESYKFTTTREYAHLEPTDLVTLPTNDASYTARILTKREQPNGIIEWEAKKEGVSVYTQSGAGAAPTNYVPQSIFTPGTTVLELMDAPLLRDQDAGKGFPVAMAGTSASWTGAQVFRSLDDGSTYSPEFSQSAAAVIGTATTALGDFTAGDIFDDGNSVTVHVQPGGSLVSYSQAQALNGSGAFVLGAAGRWEVGIYTTATLTAPNTYALTGLLRGRRGTEWATGTHAIGDHFILVNPTAWRFFDPGPGDVNVERLYKAPAFRASLSSAAEVPFTDELVRLRPYSVVQLKAEPADDGYLVSWLHRSITGGEWRDGVDVPLDAAFDAFTVTILDQYGGVKNKYSSSTESFAYTNAQLLSDFGARPATFKVRVAQKNSNFGEGVGVTISSDASTAPAYDITAPTIIASVPTPSAPVPATSYRILVPKNAPTAESQLGPWKVLQSMIYPTMQHGYCYFNGAIYCVLGLSSPDGLSIGRIEVVQKLNPATGLWSSDTADWWNVRELLETDCGSMTVQGGQMHLIVTGTVGAWTGFMWNYWPDGYSGDRPAGARWEVDNAFPLYGGTELQFPPVMAGDIGATIGTKVFYPTAGKVLDFATHTVSDIALPPSGLYYTQPLTPPYTPDSNPAVAAVGSKVYIMGSSDVTRIYDTATDTYSSGAAHPVSGLEHAKAVAIGTIIYVIGGRIGSGFTDRVFAYDTAANTWTEKTRFPAVTSYMHFPGVIKLSAGSGTQGRIDFGLNAVGGKIYLTGGGPLALTPAIDASLTLPPNNLSVVGFNPSTDPSRALEAARKDFYGMTFEYDPSLD
jgi:hypothetical protein